MKFRREANNLESEASNAARATQNHVKPWEKSSVASEAVLLISFESGSGPVRFSSQKDSCHLYSRQSEEPMNRAGRLMHTADASISTWTIVGLSAVFVVNFVCFYWWVSDSYFFTGDCLFYFSRHITSFADLYSKFLSVDEIYQYRPLPYVFFSFVLLPLLGTNPTLYHVAAYVIALINILLVCGCCYFWLGGDRRLTLIASVFLILNPINFFPAYGLAYIDVLLSLLFYLLALILILANSRWASVLAPLLAVLALLSREHSVLLPAQALLILLATGVSMRQAVSRTRNVWLVVAAYAVFQLVIRDGAVFAPETANSNLHFDFSLERLRLLVQGMKPAIFFPESIYLNEFLNDYRRVARLAFVFPWLGMILWVVLRRNRIAISGFIWAPLSLLPIAFIEFPPFARHYYMALPGLAVLFASVVRSTRVMAYVATVYALVTVTSVSMYAHDSWIADGSRLTKKYFAEIQSMVNRTGRTDFYVLNEGDRYFSWHIDGGMPVDRFLGRKLSWRFAANSSPLPMDLFLSNSINVVIPTWEGFQDVLAMGRFPQFRDPNSCDRIRRLTDSEANCAVFYRGFPVQNVDIPIAETPNGLPIFDLNDEIVTLSRTTVFLKDSGEIAFNAMLRVAPDSVDGLSVEIHRVLKGKFEALYQTALRPGEQIELKKNFDATASVLVLRIGPGTNGDDKGDKLTWKLSP
jgi:hypothetical protein